MAASLMSGLTLSAPGTAHAEPATEGTIDFYVSALGSDTTGDGTKANPFKTAQAAQEAVRQLSVLEQDVRIIFEPGTHYLGEPIEIGVKDSGRDGHTVSYTSEPGASGETRLVGGVPVTDWEKTEDGLWKAPVPEATGEDGFWTMFDNGSRLTNARTTDEQAMYRPPKDISHLQVIRGGTSWFGEALKVIKGDKGFLDTEYPKSNYAQRVAYYQGAREYIDEPGEWAIEEDYVYLKTDYGDPKEHEIVAPTVDTIFEIQGDGEKSIETFEQVDEGELVKDVTIEGLTIEMNDFGPNFLAHSGRLREGWGTERPDSQEWDMNMIGMVHISNAKNITVKDNKLLNSGRIAVTLLNCAHDNTVAGNLIDDAGVAGVWLIGDNPNKQSQAHNKRNTITNNVISNLGYWISHGAGIYIMTSSDNEISHNDISYSPRYGISMKGYADDNINTMYQTNRSSRNLIAYNYVHDTGARSNDGGGIEGWYPGRDNVIDHNIIYNAYTGVPSTNWRGHSIFLDDAVRYTTVTNNITYDTKSPAVNAGVMVKGIELNIKNNVFDTSLASDGAANIQINQRPTYDQSFDHNIIYSDLGGTVNSDGTWSEEGDGKRDAFHYRNSYEVLNFKSFDQNLYWNAQGETKFRIGTDTTLDLPAGWISFSDWQKNNEGFDAASAEADPKFDYHATDKYDYRLAVDSPAWDLGIHSIEASGIGVTSDYKFATDNTVKSVYVLNDPEGGDGTDIKAETAGGTYQLYAVARTAERFQLTDFQADWSSSDPTVATVDANGLVTLHKSGTVKITASYQGVEGWFTIVNTQADVPDVTPEDKPDTTPDVKPDTKPDTMPDSNPSSGSGQNAGTGVATVTDTEPALVANSLRAEASSVVMAKGKKLTVDALGTLSNGKADKLTYKSSKKSVVKVSSKGKLTALKPGTATITISTASNGTAGKPLTAKVKVKVVKKAAKVSSVKLSPVPRQLKVGQTMTLTAKWSKASAGITGIAITSSDKSIATVDKVGTLTAKKAGTVKITVNVSGVKKSYKVKVAK
jgi:uncharacterized protein YjdB